MLRFAAHLVPNDAAAEAGLSLTTGGDADAAETLARMTSSDDASTAKPRRLALIPPTVDAARRAGVSDDRVSILDRVAATRTRGRPPKLLIELFVVVALMTAAAIAIYFGFRSPPIHDELPLGGRNVDISRSSAAQFEASVAADPSNRKILLAGSMDDLVDARVYVSTDAGVSWTSRPAPPLVRGSCGLSHPAVAIGPAGLQVYASL